MEENELTFKLLFFLELEYGKGQSSLTYVCNLVFVLLNRLEGCEYIVQANEETETGAVS